jgi:glycosyltransferase involved in cell wall biosynthesis
VTDAWVPPKSPLAALSAGLGERFHPDLAKAPVQAWNSGLLAFEAIARLTHLSGWRLILARNRWFQRKVVSFLHSHLSTLNSQLVLCSYSYTALEPFRYAKAHGWETLLVQIDPGPEEERIVAEEAARVPQLAGDWQPAPAEYWASWHEECNLADRIVVNSEWSREGVIRGGVPVEKLSVIPLAYEMTGPPDHETPRPRPREYPDRFTLERPMRVLFLGLINLRKGVARLLEAARILCDEPVEFWIVGPVKITNASATVDAGCVKWFGPVSRRQGAEFYRDADVFILPTLSDGFAITQLEAQAHGLPIIASKFCGNVVESEVNGIILEDPTAECIAVAVRECLANPNRLQEFAAASRMPDKSNIDALAKRLQELGSAL